MVVSKEIIQSSACDFCFYCGTFSIIFVLLLIFFAINTVYKNNSSKGMVSWSFKNETKSCVIGERGDMLPIMMENLIYFYLCLLSCFYVKLPIYYAKGKSINIGDRGKILWSVYAGAKIITECCSFLRLQSQ